MSAGGDAPIEPPPNNQLRYEVLRKRAEDKVLDKRTEGA
jgi:hypothetical protein